MILSVPPTLSDQVPPYQSGLALRDAGLDLLDNDTYEVDPWLTKARAAAIELAEYKVIVTIDDVYRIIGLPPRPNLAGCVFRKGWAWTGDMVESKRPERRGAWNRKWRRA